MLEVPFASQEGASSVEQNSRERLINMYASIEVSGKKRLIRRQRPGVQLVQALAGESRCIERNKGIHYIIKEGSLYSYNGSLLTKLGDIGTNTGRCTMVFNDNDQILISDGLTGYCWNGTDIVDVSTPVSIGPVAYQGGFGIFGVPYEGQFYITGINDFTSVNGLDFATAESSTDNIVRVFVDHNEIWLFGQTSTEIWQLSGGLDFPFSRFSNAQLERGCLAVYSVCADDNTVFWLGDDRVFYRADGYRPIVISNPSIDEIVEKIPADIRSKADAFVYTTFGGKFYTVRFPGYVTLQFNIKTGFWNVAKTFGKNDWEILGSAGHNVDFYLTSSGIVKLVSGLSTDEGGIISRGGVSAPIYTDGSRGAIRAFFVDVEYGRAPVNQQAKIMMRVARDGETFQNELWRDFGKIGEYTHRAVWRNIGMGRQFTFELTVTDPVEFSIISTQIMGMESSS